jgi:chromosome segregation ATPase
MADDSSDDGLRRRLARSSEDALGKLAQDLLENSLVNGALTRAFEAREKAAQAQEVAMGALNLPSAADLERLTRRIRSLSQRLEGIEDGVDRLDQRIAALNASGGLDDRLAAIDKRLAAISRDVRKLSAAAGPARTGRAATATPAAAAPDATASEGAGDPAAPAPTSP